MKAIIGLGEIKELLKTDKAVKLLLIVGAALILFAALGGLLRRDTGKSQNTSEHDFSSYEQDLENRLCEILSAIDGVGDAKVMVTLDTSERTEYGKSADMQVEVTAPKVRGVIVVCDGGGSVAVRERVVNAVTGVFGISSLRISVAESG
ncbi:MAG: hypothetical protein IK093_02760 [Ruminiclostridium sp.]|nr:hypothetical protein [Ruminiclostridium sp.]